jgi:hypothetical protein
MTRSSAGGQSQRLYTINGDSYRYFITGKGADASQFLIVLQEPDFIAIQFDQHGVLGRSLKREMRTAWETPQDSLDMREAFATKSDPALREFVDSVGFAEGPIVTQHFFVIEYGIGLVNFPRAFSEYLASPSDYSSDDVTIAQAERVRWEKEMLYELWLNPDTNLWMKSTGEIESS